MLTWRVENLRPLCCNALQLLWRRKRAPVTLVLSRVRLSKLKNWSRLGVARIPMMKSYFVWWTVTTKPVIWAFCLSFFIDVWQKKDCDVAVHCHILLPFFVYWVLCWWSDVLFQENDAFTFPCVCFASKVLLLAFVQLFVQCRTVLQFLIC